MRDHSDFAVMVYPSLPLIMANYNSYLICLLLGILALRFVLNPHPWEIQHKQGNLQHHSYPDEDLSMPFQNIGLKIIKK